jgi:hypothetical protein
VLSSQYHCHGPPNGSSVNTNGIDQPIACHIWHTSNRIVKLRTLPPAGSRIQTWNARASYTLLQCDGRLCILSMYRRRSLLHYGMRYLLNRTVQYDICRLYKLYYIHLVFGN